MEIITVHTWENLCVPNITGYPKDNWSIIEVLYRMTPQTEYIERSSAFKKKEKGWESYVLDSKVLNNLSKNFYSSVSMQRTKQKHNFH